MDPNHKLWNDNHQKLNRALAIGNWDAALPIFLEQHAMVHSPNVSKSGLWSFEEEVLGDMTEEEIRNIPEGGEHSIAWILFHLARIEDIVMNMLVAGTAQIFIKEHWAEKMNVSFLHSANEMSDRAVAELSATVDVECLRDYRTVVTRRTRLIVQKLRAEDLKKKVNPAHLEKVLQEGAVTPEAVEIVHYWGKKTIAGLLLMPPTRHCILHLNEAMRIKERIRRGK